MRTTGKILMAIGLVLLFVCLSEVNKSPAPLPDQSGKYCLYLTMPAFFVGLYLYFKSREKKKNNPGNGNAL